MKTVGADAFITYHTLYHYFKISKIRPKFKKGSIIKESTSKTYDIIINACVKYENYLIKTVGEDAFYSYYIGPIITLFRNFKKSQKIQK